MDFGQIDNRFNDYLLAECGFSENTATAYRSDVQQLLKYINKNIKNTTKEDIRGFIKKLYTDGLAPKTRMRKLASLHSFFEFLVEIGMIEKDPTRGVKSPKRNKTIPKVLSLKEIHDALNFEGGNKFLDTRDSAMIHFLFSTGLRLSEFSNIKLRDIDMERREVVVNGKGNKERIVPIPMITIKKLKTYLSERRKVLRRNAKRSWYLWIGIHGDKIGNRGIQSTIKKRFKNVGLEEAHLHTLRASFATHMLRNGADIYSIKELLGHSSVETTEQYLLASQEMIRNTYNKTHPFATGGLT